MMSRRVRMATLSSVDRVFKLVVFIIPFRAATIRGPCIFTGIPGLSTLATILRFGLPDRTLCRL